MNLFGKWEKLSEGSQTNVSQRVVAAGLPQYIGVDGRGFWIFYSLSTEEPRAWPQIGPIETDKKVVHGVWQITLTLTDDEFRQEFAYLCEDLVSKVVGISDEVEALQCQKLAYEDWIAFFRGVREFSAEQARGLFGELTFITDELESGTPADLTVLAWRGPLGASQDFVFDGFKAVEVKTIQEQVASINIASENQLSFPGRLILKIYRIQENRVDGLGSTLAELVDQIEGSLDELTQREFRKRLGRLGYSKSSKYASESRFSLGSAFQLDANSSDFPKVIPSELRPGVSNLRYKISLTALLGKGFETNAS